MKMPCGEHSPSYEYVLPNNLCSTMVAVQAVVITQGG